MKALRSVAAPMELDPHHCVQAGTHLVKTDLHVLLSYYSSCKSMEVGAALASWVSALGEILLHLTGGSGGGMITSVS